MLCGRGCPCTWGVQVGLAHINEVAIEDPIMATISRIICRLFEVAHEKKGTLGFSLAIGNNKIPDKVKKGPLLKSLLETEISSVFVGFSW